MIVLSSFSIMIVCCMFVSFGMDSKEKGETPPIGPIAKMGR